MHTPMLTDITKRLIDRLAAGSHETRATGHTYFGSSDRLDILRADGELLVPG